MAPEGAAGSRRERISGVEVLHFRPLEMLESFNELSDYRPTLKQENVRGRRLALATTALMSPPMHPEARLKGESLDLYKRARVSRRAGVIDSCLLWLSQKDIEGKCLFYSFEQSEPCVYKKKELHFCNPFQHIAH